jgi:hypothetical protein
VQQVLTKTTDTDPTLADGGRLLRPTRIEHLYASAGRDVSPGADDPVVVFCVDPSRDPGTRNGQADERM